MPPKAQDRWKHDDTRLIVQALAAGEFEIDAPIAEIRAVLPALNPKYSNHQIASVIKRIKEKTTPEDMKYEENCNKMDLNNELKANYDNKSSNNRDRGKIFRSLKLFYYYN
jgi:hypothetical protein